MKPTREMKAAMAQADKVLGERGKVREAIAKTNQELQTLEASRTEAQLQLAAEEADAALSDAPAKPGPGRQAMTRVRDERERLEARLIGLESKLAQNDEAVLEAEQHYRQPDRSFCDEQIEADEREWQKLVESLIPQARVLVSRRAGLRGTPLFQFEGIKFPALDGIGSLPIEVVPRKMSESGLTNALLDDKGARKSYDEASPLRQTREALQKEVGAIRKDREERDAAEAKAVAEGRPHNTPREHREVQVPANEAGRGTARYEHGKPIAGEREYGLYHRAGELHEQSRSIEEIAKELQLYPSTVEGWIRTHEREKQEKAAATV